MSEQDIAGVLAAAMAAENRRRELAGNSPGLGAPMSLDDTAYGPAVGKPGLLPVTGEGYGQGPLYVPQSKAYGPRVPAYADGLVGGQGYDPGSVQGAVRSLAEQVFAAQDRAAAGPGFEVISPRAAPRRSLLGRMLGKLRRR